MSTHYGLVVCEGKNMNNKYQKERCRNSSIHIPFFITDCIEEMWTTTHLFVDGIMCELPTGWTTRVFEQR